MTTLLLKREKQPLSLTPGLPPASELRPKNGVSRRYLSHGSYKADGFLATESTWLALLKTTNSAMQATRLTNRPEDMQLACCAVDGMLKTSLGWETCQFQTTTATTATKPQTLLVIGSSECSILFPPGFKNT